MLTLIKILLFLLSSKTWALSTLEIGSRKAIGSKSGYHFSSKDLISIQSKKGTLYIIGKKIGELEYKKENKTHKLLILNKEQNLYFKRVNFIVKNSPLLNWSIIDSKLVIKGNASLDESSTLMNICRENKLSTISLQIGIKDFTKNERPCLGFLKTYHLELAFLNKDLLSGQTFGLGAPLELGWRFNNKFLIDEVKGLTTANQKKAWAKGHSFFEVDAEAGKNLNFESGSEILIRPSGVFTRQQNEWKTATTRFEIKIDKEHENFVETSLIIKRNKQSGEEGVFSVEKFNQSKTLFLNQWKKVFTFKDNGKTHTKNKLLGFSALGSNSKNKNSSQKEFWIRISEK